MINLSTSPFPLLKLACLVSFLYVPKALLLFILTHKPLYCNCWSLALIYEVFAYSHILFIFACIVEQINTWANVWKGNVVKIQISVRSITNSKGEQSEYVANFNTKMQSHFLSQLICIFIWKQRSFLLSICRQLRKTYINGGINPKNNPTLIWLWTHSTCVLVGSVNLSWTPEFYTSSQNKHAHILILLSLENSTMIHLITQVKRLVFLQVPFNTHVCAWSLSCVQLFATPWTVALRLLFTRGFLR